MHGLKWLGLFSSAPATPRGSALDTLCGLLEARMAYAPGERDLVLLQHRFEVVYADGRRETRLATLERTGEPGGHSAMALLVGLPAGIATQLVLDGAITRTGVSAPYDAELCDPIREVLEKEGVRMVETVL